MAPATLDANPTFIKQGTKQQALESNDAPTCRPPIKRIPALLCFVAIVAAATTMLGGLEDDYSYSAIGLLCQSGN